MKIVAPSIDLYDPPDYEDLVSKVEYFSRISTKTEEKESGEDFIARRIKAGELNVLRHASLSVIFNCSRRMSHELVRHHVGIGMTQESTRWCNYANGRFEGELTFVCPYGIISNPARFAEWKMLMERVEGQYMAWAKLKVGPDDMGYLLPNSLKTTVGVTANLEAWRTLIHKRTQPNVLPEFKELMLLVRSEFISRYPVFFADMVEPEAKESGKQILTEAEVQVSVVEPYAEVHGCFIAGGDTSFLPPGEKYRYRKP